MRLFVFNCFLLASVAVASPNGRHKRHLAHLKNFLSPVFFGRSQINIQPSEPSPFLQEEVGYKLFRLPGYEDVMIKVTPKKPVVEEFVYPPAVEKVNLNAFGKVVGTKSKGDTLYAVQGVNNLFSTGILYGGHNNVMKENIVPMFPYINSANYVVEEKIQTSPVIQTKPALTEVIENRPAFKEVIESRPVFQEMTQSRPVFTEVVENRPALTQVIESRPIFQEMTQSRPVFTEVVDNRPALTEVIESRPIFQEIPQSRPVFTEVQTQFQQTRPVIKEVIETRPVVSEVIETRPCFTEVINSRPVLTEEVRPVEERVELLPFEPTYSYKQTMNNEPVMTYTAHTNPGVEVLETIKTKTELPMCIKKRVDEAIVLGAGPSQSAPVQETIQYQNPPVFDFSYPTVDANFYEQNSFRGEVLSEEFDTVSGFGLAPQRFRPSFQDRPARYDLRPTKTKAINPRPIPLHSHKSLHFEEDITATKDNVKDNSQTKKVQAFTNLGEKVNIANTLGPIPPQYITQVNNKGGNVAVSKDKMKQMKTVPIVGSKDNVSKAKISSNVYRLQVNPNTWKTLKENSVLRTNVKTNTNRSAMAPAVAAKKDNAEVKNVVYTNKVTAKPQTITTPVVVPSVNAPKISSLRESIQTSPINKQIVAKEVNNYTYQQKNADGSSLNINGNKHGVSVNIKDNNRGRGDIPGQE